MCTPSNGTPRKRGRGTCHVMEASFPRCDFIYFRKNFALVRIYYGHMDSRVYTEVPSYTIAQLAADFGGMLGIVLGPSVITFVEFFFCIVGLLVYAVTQGGTSIL